MLKYAVTDKIHRCMIHRGIYMFTSRSMLSTLISAYRHIRISTDSSHYFQWDQTWWLNLVWSAHNELAVYSCYISILLSQEENVRFHDYLVSSDIFHLKIWYLFSTSNLAVVGSPPSSTPGKAGEFVSESCISVTNMICGVQAPSLALTGRGFVTCVRMQFTIYIGHSSVQCRPCFDCAESTFTKWIPWVI